MPAEQRHTRDSHLGTILAIFTSVLFSITVILLGVILSVLDAATTTFLRSFMAAIIVSVYLALKGLIKPGPLSARKLVLLVGVGAAFAGFQLAANTALNYIPPSAVQVTGQVSILFTTLAGILVLGERLSRIQGGGMLLLFLGLGLFFHHRLSEIASLQGNYSLGLLFMVFSTSGFAASVILQKLALQGSSSSIVVVAQFWVASCILLPLSQPAALLAIPNDVYMPIIALGTITALSSGCYAEALRRAPASRIAPLIALNPLITIALVHPALLIWPGAFTPEKIDGLSLVGAILVILGSLSVSLPGLASKRATRAPDIP